MIRFLKHTGKRIKICGNYISSFITCILRAVYFIYYVSIFHTLHSTFRIRYIVSHIPILYSMPHISYPVSHLLFHILYSISHNQYPLSHFIHHIFLFAPGILHSYVHVPHALSKILHLCSTLFYILRVTFPHSTSHILYRIICILHSTHSYSIIQR